MTIFKHNGLDFYYEVTGRGEPLILLNGLGCDTRVMEPLAGRLKDSFTVINYDMSSAGRSGKPKSPFTIEQIAGDVFHLVEHLGYKKIGVLGFSMGAMAAMELFRLHKDVVGMMVLLSPTPSFRRPHPVPEGMISMLRCTDVSPGLLKQVYESMFGTCYRRAHPLEEYIKMRMEDTNPQPVGAYLRQLSACEAFDATDYAGHIDVPVLIVAGDEDRLIPRANFEWLHKNIAGSKLSMLGGVGHMVPLEAPDELADMILTL